MAGKFIIVHWETIHWLWIWQPLFTKKFIGQHISEKSKIIGKTLIQNNKLVENI